MDRLPPLCIRRCVRRRRFVPACPAIALLAGSCGLAVLGCADRSEPPSGLQPVAGSVFTADGQLLSSGGMIEFRRLDDASMRATSLIRPDGSFELHTAQANARRHGAPPGEYAVTMYPSGAGLQVPLVVDGTVTVPVEGATSLHVTVGRASE